MIYDPKYVCGDIVASLWWMPADFDGLIERFDNNTNGLLQMAVQSTVRDLIRRGYLYKMKNGVLRCTLRGKDYIKRKGYFD